MNETLRKPPWLKVKLPGGPNYLRLKSLLRAGGLHTVCEEARCPNIGECFDNLTATFLILGNICTRNCGYCAVAHGRPSAIDPLEPRRIAHTVKVLGLDHVVITSVDRDDLKDGGASAFAETVRWVRELTPGCSVEVLIPDFRGSKEALKQILSVKPDILNHNTETVPRLYRKARPGGSYLRTLEILSLAGESGIVTKSGLMVGLGETDEELINAMEDLRSVGCTILTLGQYLRPSEKHLAVARYYLPEEFLRLKQIGDGMGFGLVESGPLVRSSYHARSQIQNVKRSL